MTLVRKLFCLGLLIGVAAAAYLKLRPIGEQGPEISSRAARDTQVRSFTFTYTSQSYLNPSIPGQKQQGQGLTINCESSGLLNLMPEKQETFELTIEFTSVLCAGQNLIETRGLLRSARFTPEFLASAATVERATRDPGLAIARSLFMQMNLGGRSQWPEPSSAIKLDELRPEGMIGASLQAFHEKNESHWDKHWKGTLQGQGASLSLQHQLDYRVKGMSEIASPLELGLTRLEGHEQSLSFHQKNLVARTNIQVRIERIPPIRTRDLQDLLARSERNIEFIPPRTLPYGEKAKILDRWRKFRDGAGQKLALGASEDNQEVYLELKQALRSDPEFADEFVGELAELEPESSAFASLAGAMVYSGEPRALDAFIQAAMLRSDDKQWQERSVPLVGLAPVPTAQSWRYLAQTRRAAKSLDVSRAAELAMATHLKRGYRDQEFILELKGRMEQAQTEPERMLLLDLVGNAGLDQFYPTIASWVPASSLVLRVRIAQALRFIQDPAAESLLLNWAQDPQVELALSALNSLRERSLGAGSIPVLLNLLVNTSDERIQLKALENLYDARQMHPGLLPRVKAQLQAMRMTPIIAATWAQLEKDWIDETAI